MKNRKRIGVLLLSLYLLLNAQADAQEVPLEYGYICVYIDTPVDSALLSNSKKETLEAELGDYIKIIINFDKSEKASSFRLMAYSETWQLDDTLKITKKPMNFLIKKDCFEKEPIFSVIIGDYYYDIPVIYGYENYTLGPSDKIGIYNVHYWN